MRTFRAARDSWGRLWHEHFRGTSAGMRTIRAARDSWGLLWHILTRADPALTQVRYIFREHAVPLRGLRGLMVPLAEITIIVKFITFRKLRTQRSIRTVRTTRGLPDLPGVSCFKIPLAPLPPCMPEVAAYIKAQRPFRARFPLFIGILWIRRTTPWRTSRPC